MKVLKKYGLLLSGASVAILSGCDKDCGAEFMGEQNGFYRQAQILASWLDNGHGLEVIPDYYNELGDFPYQRKDSPKEIPFADRITVSRFLVGWGPGFGGIKDVAEARMRDLVRRNEDGSLEYHWGGQMDYIKKYLDAGISELVLSIDNIPYDLADGAKIADFGQARPHKEIREWQTFFETFLNEMEKRYGTAFMNTVSFRVGTEFNRTHTYTGNLETYLEWYRAAAESVKKKFPGAKIGLCEICGWFEPGMDNIDFVEVLNTLLAEGVPVDFIANSSHAYPVWLDTGELIGCVDPRERAEKSVWLYKHLLKDQPQLIGEIPVYVFQFGILRSEILDDAGTHLISDEPGPRGAAWTLIALMETRRLWPSIKGIGHWDVTAAVPGKPQMRLLKGNGWVYTVLDHLRGREMYALDAGGEAPNGSYCKAYAFVDPESDKHYVMAATFNVDRAVSDSLPVEIRLPKKLSGKIQSIRSCKLTAENSPFHTLRTDLLATGLLPAAYATHREIVAEPRLYAGKDQVLCQKMNAVFETEFPRYREMVKGSLKLMPSSATIDGGLLQVELEMPSVQVFEITLEK